MPDSVLRMHQFQKYHLLREETIGENTVFLFLMLNGIIFCFQGHHFMIAAMPSKPYTEMIPAGFSADGRRTYRMTGFFAEVFDNLQVSEASKMENQ